jgi:hypothetical protein
MGKGKANETAPKSVVAVEASAAATTKREGNTVMISFFHPAAVEKRSGRKKKAKTEAGRQASKKEKREGSPSRQGKAEGQCYTERGGNQKAEDRKTKNLPNPACHSSPTK